MNLCSIQKLYLPVKCVILKHGKGFEYNSLLSRVSLILVMFRVYSIKCCCDSRYGACLIIFISFQSSSSKVIIPVTASIGGLAAIAGISALIYKLKTSTTNTGYKSTRIKSLNSSALKRNHVAADNTRPNNLNF